jgi:hypothetical protein
MLSRKDHTETVSDAGEGRIKPCKVRVQMLPGGRSEDTYSKLEANCLRSSIILAAMYLQALS